MASSRAEHIQDCLVAVSKATKALRRILASGGRSVLPAKFIVPWMHLLQLRQLSIASRSVFLEVGKVFGWSPDTLEPANNPYGMPCLL